MQSILQSLEHPPRLHALVVHLPLGAAIFGMLAAIALAITGGKSAAIRWTCLAIFAVGLGGAVAGLYTGDEAEEWAPSEVWTEPAHAEMEQHEEMGEVAWIPFAAACLAIALTALPQRSMRLTMTLLAVVAAFSALAWVSITAHHGGKLLYVHGVGTPQVRAPAEP